MSRDRCWPPGRRRMKRKGHRCREELSRAHNSHLGLAASLPPVLSSHHMLPTSILQLFSGQSRLLSSAPRTHVSPCKAADTKPPVCSRPRFLLSPPYDLLVDAALVLRLAAEVSPMTGQFIDGTGTTDVTEGIASLDSVIFCGTSERGWATGRSGAKRPRACSTIRSQQTTERCLGTSSRNDERGSESAPAIMTNGKPSC